ncbi:MAG: carboxypeptidase-like regulatory domain-containing protein [Candidatus Azobacteroides sp.]|nr:carboxypeptidase-like regulatory domain-containing protein [Candidatus Azobacteroides sp.]
MTNLLQLKNILMTLLLLMGCFSLSAQIRIEGSVSDIEKNLPIESVNISLLRQDSSFVKGTRSDKEGKFSINNIAEGNYIISASFVGYATSFILLENIDKSVNIGNINLAPSAVMLDDVVVSAGPVIRKADKQVIFPSPLQTKAANTGIALLRNLQLPRVVINPVDNSITSVDGGELQLRINGVQASKTDIAALLPNDILRIDYYDNPGLRYQNASIVLDFITRKKESGGNIAVNLMNAVSDVRFGENFVAAKYNHKKSEFSTNIYWESRGLKWTRENKEIFNFPDQSLERIESGEPTKFKYDNIDLSLNYNLQNNDNYLFNVKFRYTDDNTPNELGDRVSYILQNAEKLNIYDHSSTFSESPALDIYYLQKLKNNQQLIFNIVGTYINTENSRIYQENRGDEITTDIYSHIMGDKYSLIGEADYEKTLKNGKISGGIKHTQSYLKNNYTGDTNALVDMNTAETYAYIEYQLNFNKLNYTFGLGGMRTYNSQDRFHDEKYIFRPTFRVAYHADNHLFLRYNAYVSGYSPSLSDLNDVEQTIDSLQIKRGNPALKSVTYFSNAISANWTKGIFALELFSSYSYDYKPVMESITYEDGIFIRSNENQKGFHRLMFRLTPQLQPCDYIAVSVTPWFNRYISEGIEYTHTYSYFGIKGSLTAMYKNWSLTAEMNTRNNDLWGETITYGERLHTILIGYNTDRWSISARAINPFSKNYDLKTKLLSSLIYSEQSAYSDKLKQLFIVNFSMNLNFGRKYNTKGRSIQNEDTNSGILSGKKYSK